MELEKLRHECKFCKKSFPCGRSLGGHIRTHLPKPGYELRDNPKKTWRAADHHHDLLINNSSFSSSSTKMENSKAIKVNQIQGKRSNFTCSNSHSSVSEQEEIVAVCLIMLSQDVGSWRDDITSLVTPAKSLENVSLSQGKSNKKFQGKFSVGADNGIKYENATKGYVQEGLKSKEIEVSANKFDSNDQNSKNLESKRRREKLQNKATDYAGKITKVKSEACGYVKDDAKIKKFEELENGFVPNDQNKQSPEIKRKIGQITASGYVKKGSNFEEYESSDDEIVLYDQKSNHHISKSSFCKRSKFECSTCNKVFHSYQALGGHRASHKRLVVGSGCCLPVSKLKENDIASIDVPPSPDDRKHQEPKQEQEQEREQKIVPEVRMGTSSSNSSKKVVQQHECPICFRVFPSGQALGGHKRSHLLVASNPNITNTMPEKISNDQSSKFVEVVERSTNTETTDLLDLNFPPAPNQDETTTTTSKTSLVEFIKPYWCVESSHSKHEPLLGLISN